MAQNVESRVEGNRVTYRRHVAVPPALAFEAWSTPEHLAQWWGPDGFTLTTRRLEFRAGGLWEFTMHGPNGQDFGNRVKFLEVRPGRLLRYTHMGDGKAGDEPEVRFESEVRFDPSGDGTDLTMVQIFPSPEDLRRVEEQYHAIEGAKQHIGKLAQYVESLQTRRP